MTVTLLYFASVREAVGMAEEKRELPEGIATPRDIIGWLAAEGDHYEAAFANPDKLRCAVDQVMTALDAPLGKAREIAFFPPVTGG